MTMHPAKKISLVLAVGLVVPLLFVVLYTSRPTAISLDYQLDEDEKVKVSLAVKKPLGEVEFRIFKEPSHGRLLGSTQNLVYEPRGNFFGEDYLQYIAIVDGVESQPAWVSFTVIPKNDPPKVSPLFSYITKNQPQTLHLKASDPDHDFLTYKVKSPPKHGTLKGEAPNYQYTPAKGYLGKDHFVVLVEDVLGETREAIVSLKIEKPNHPPDASFFFVQTTMGKRVEIRFQASDVERDTITYEVLSQPKKGTLHLEGEKLYYTPYKGFIGGDSFEYQAKDYRGTSLPATVQISVQAVVLQKKTQARLQEIIQHGGVISGKVKNPDVMFRKGNYVPASILKVATASAAMHYLGKDYRFQTEVYQDQKGAIYIKGYGDPAWSSEDWHLLAEKILCHCDADRKITAVVLDDSAFAKNQKIDGRSRSTHVYDAPFGALATNQNTAKIRIHKKGKLEILDPKTPITPFLRSKTRYLGVGYRHMAVAQTAEEGADYSLDLARAIFQGHGLTPGRGFHLGKTPKGLQAIHVVASGKNLEGLLAQMLEESNNFIANQLVLAIALKRYGAPARLDDGVFLLENFLEREVGLKSYELTLEEGSGLSRENQLDLAAMLQIMEYFKPYKYLLSDLKESRYPDLARIGRRSKVLAKTGTLNDVSNLAGYIYTKNQEWTPFVVMLKENSQTRGKVVDALVQAYR